MPYRPRGASQDGVRSTVDRVSSICDGPDDEHFIPWCFGVHELIIVRGRGDDIRQTVNEMSRNGESNVETLMTRSPVCLNLCLLRCDGLPSAQCTIHGPAVIGSGLAQNTSLTQSASSSGSTIVGNGGTSDEVIVVSASDNHAMRLRPLMKGLPCARTSFDCLKRRIIRNVASEMRAS